VHGKDVSRFEITVPTTPQDFEQYYELRWRILRAPWNQPRGSERESDDDTAIHIMIKDREEDRVVACGRIHFIDEFTAQIRFMAVEERYQGQGLGSQLLHALEGQALSHHRRRIILQARENAIPFYRKNGYCIVRKTQLLFGVIQHYLMEKVFEPAGKPSE
jgi:GNAT superfamily N-acetyltransferase